MADTYDTGKSRALYAEGCEYITGGVASTLHKSANEDYPLYIERGEGSKIYDVDGNEYIDYMGAFGPMILGYCPPAVNKAVTEQLAKGSQFAAPTESLNRLSRELVEIIPCADRVIYQNSGTEANLAAFRFARANTGKMKIVKFEGHYHGWADEVLVSFSGDSLKMMGPYNAPYGTLGMPGQNPDVLNNIIVLPWNDLDILKKTVERHGHEIAAVITEPIMANCEPVFPKEGFLEGVREITAENDIVFIFDEIITGFRLSLGGAQEYFGVTPDMSTFGKACAAGYPMSGVAGKKDVMECGVFTSGTFNANPICVAAGLATLGELKKPGVYEHLEGITKKLIQGVKDIAQNKGVTLYCGGEGSIWQMAFGIQERMDNYRDNFKVNTAATQQLRKYCLKRGIRLHPSRGRFYTSLAHTDADVEKTLSIFEEAFDKLF